MILRNKKVFLDCPSLICPIRENVTRDFFFLNNKPKLFDEEKNKGVLENTDTTS